MNDLLEATIVEYGSMEYLRGVRAASVRFNFLLDFISMEVQ